MCFPMSKMIIVRCP